MLGLIGAFAPLILRFAGFWADKIQENKDLAKLLAPFVLAAQKNNVLSQILAADDERQKKELGG